MSLLESSRLTVGLRAPAWWSDSTSMAENHHGRAPARWSTSTSKMKNRHGRAPAGPMRNVCKRFPGLHLAKGTCIHTVFAVLVYIFVFCANTYYAVTIVDPELEPVSENSRILSFLPNWLTFQMATNFRIHFEPVPSLFSSFKVGEELNGHSVVNQWQLGSYH